MSNTGSGKARRVTMRDVALLAGVDRSIVSRTLNGRPDARVRSETRQKIYAAVETLGYQPNAVARGLRLSQTSTFGLIVPDLSNPIYAQIVQGAQVRAAERDYVIVVGNSQESQDSEASYARLVMQGRVDALLVASGTMADATLRELASNSPVVSVNRRIRGVRASVILDDVAAGRMAATHLIELGHDRLAMIIGRPDVDTSTRRRKGFAAAATQLKQVVYSDPIDTSADSGAEAAHRVLSEHPETTGIVVYSLRAALGARFAIQEMGLRIPEDVSLIAIHDDPFAAFASPPMTTIRMPMRELGAAAVDMAFERLAGEAQRSETLQTPPQLIVRRSTAAPPDASARRRASDRHDTMTATRASRTHRAPEEKS